MPIDYKDYPPNWKTELRPAILQRANNCCEVCNVPNYKGVFRGYMDKREVYQDIDGNIYDANTSEYIKCDCYEIIEPSTGDPNQVAIRIVLTIAHLDHDTTNNELSNLKAMCQRCHNRYDVAHRKQTRNKKKGQSNLF